MFELLGKEVKVTRADGTCTMGQLIKTTPEYAMIMRDCEYYLIHDVICMCQA